MSTRSKACPWCPRCVVRELSVHPANRTFGGLLIDPQEDRTARAVNSWAAGRNSKIESRRSRLFRRPPGHAAGAKGSPAPPPISGAMRRFLTMEGLRPDRPAASTPSGLRLRAHAGFVERN
jgi:hypothetical protein